MNILLIYPEYPDTFWSFKNALPFVGKKAAFTPLGLLTVAAILPVDWEKKLVDMNVDSLDDEQIKWADYVFISAMEIQKDSVRKIIDRAKKQGKKIVAGGPLFTTDPGQFKEVDHLILNEAEITLPAFLKDLSDGFVKKIYTTKDRADLSKTPLPMWRLVNLKKYACMSLQYSRGCPFDCEFCDIVFLDGHIPRTKSKEQVIAEMDLLYRSGWRGSLFIVDDNFIGNKNKLKSEILPAVIKWQRERKYPFSLFTEASINLTDDEYLMEQMAEAGFNRVFVGIETPNKASLAETGKIQNVDRDMVAAVKILQNRGMEVMGGFIVGFDNDVLATIFEDHVNFIRKSGIVVAMVGLLNAPKGTRLYQRLKNENRLLKEDFTGDNMDSSLNFIPTMNRDSLVDGYKQILNTIYAPRQYYERVETFLKEYKPKIKNRFSLYQLAGLINCILIVGILDGGRRHFWKLFFATSTKRPRSFSVFIMQAIYGHHFRKVVASIV